MAKKRKAKPKKVVKKKVVKKIVKKTRKRKPRTIVPPRPTCKICNAFLRTNRRYKEPICDPCLPNYRANEANKEISLEGRLFVKQALERERQERNALLS